MKRLVLFMAALILIATTALAVMGQTRPQTVAPRPTPTPSPRPAATPVASNAAVPESRIALIDTGMFGDEKNGIFRYVDAAKSVELEFRTRTTELQTLQNRLNTLVTEIQTLRRLSVVDQKAVQAKQAEGERLQQEFNTKKERLDEDITKRYQQVVAPVSQQIGAAMDQFAGQRGITMTLDISKLMPAILTAIPAIDMTQAFISDFNSKNPRTGTPPRP